MHKILIIAATCLSLAACTTTQQGAVVGGLGGAVIGAGVTGGSAVGTLVGAGVGAVAGAAVGDVIGRVDNSSNMCIYQGRNGRTYRDTCPRG
ncbi:glycine zipper domain-containing protein [Devosia sp. A449]